MNLKKRKWIPSLTIFLIAVSGALFRLIGICKELSYWNDESHAAILARGILEFGVPVTPNGYSTGIYQSALYYVTAVFFRLFGITEFWGRIPSVIAGVVLILAGYAVGKKLFNYKVAIIISYLLAFSQIQLAWSTQLRPYIWLELLTLCVVYFLVVYLKKPKTLIDTSLAISIVFSLLASLFHGTGLINLVIILAAILYKSIKEKKYIFILALPVFGIVSSTLLYFSFSGNIEAIKSTLFSIHISPLHYRIFITHNYLWLVIGATLGFFVLLKRNKENALLFGGSIVFIFAIAMFKISPDYVRYSLSAFPLMYVLFAIGLDFIVDRLTKKNYIRWLITALVLFGLCLTNKIILWPKYYYSINADVRENPIVDYKEAFRRIGDLVRGKDDVLIIDSWNDRVPWYMPNQEYVMVNHVTTEGIDPVFGERLVGTLKGIDKEISDHQRGVVIIEDWQSFMSEDIKKYIREKLKFEFTIQDLPFNENDHWGISIYSWGL